MQSKKTAACGLLVLLLSACGGGGGDEEQKTLNGTMGSVTGDITPDPVTTAQALQLAFTARYVGQVTPAVSSFAVQYVVTRAGADYRTGTITFNLATGQPGNGTFNASAGMTLPADTAGTHVYCVRLDPRATYAMNGTVQAPQCTQVTVTP